MGTKLDDPIFRGKVVTFGACRPDIRRNVVSGDYLFVLSGARSGVQQYVIGGFAVAEKIDVKDAYKRFPENRLHLEGNIKHGNIIIDARGEQHKLDHHAADTFERRVKNFVVGKNPILLESPREVELARDRTIKILQDILLKPSARAIRSLLGRGGNRLDAQQIEELKAALLAIKADARGNRSK